MKEKREVLRTCCGCREQKNKKELIRLFLDETGAVRIDRIGKAGGRGVYVCPDQACLQRAMKTGAIGRGLKQPISPEALKSVIEEIDPVFH